MRRLRAVRSRHPGGPLVRNGSERLGSWKPLEARGPGSDQGPRGEADERGVVRHNSSAALQPERRREVRCRTRTRRPGRLATGFEGAMTVELLDRADGRHGIVPAPSSTAMVCYLETFTPQPRSSPSRSGRWTNRRRTTRDRSRVRDPQQRSGATRCLRGISWRSVRAHSIVIVAKSCIRGARRR